MTEGHDNFASIHHYQNRRRLMKLSYLHTVVIWPAATLRRNPGDDLVGVHDVAGLAVDTVGEVDRDLFCAGHIRSIDHLVNLGRTEMLAGISIFDRAARI